MERITDKDLNKAKDRKFMTESRDAVNRIGKGDKIDTSKMKLRKDNSKKDLADMYRLRMGLPKTMSDADVLKMYRQKGVTNKNTQGISDQDLKMIGKGVSDQDAALKQRIKQKEQKDKDYNNPRISDRDLQILDKKYNSLGKKAGGAKIPKKPIMDLPTNVPRLMKGALLGDLNKYGKMSGYETARQKAITKNMKS
jgi:hypothetical protein